MNRFYLFIFLIFTFLSFTICIVASENENSIADENIRTVTVCKNGTWSALPTIELNSDSYVSLSFDEMSHNYRKFSYRIYHCDFQWKKSDLSFTEFMDGFPENDVDDGVTSSKTYVQYTHYSLKLPNNNLHFKISGNYLIEVFDKYKPNECLIKARFSVFENKTVINATVTASTDIDNQKAHQQLLLNILPQSQFIRDPLRDLKFIVQQNHRFDNQVDNLKPSSILGDQISFEHDPNLIFEAGNEYRRFEITTNKYAGLNVNSLEYSVPYYRVELYPSEKRTKGYLFDKDQNGRFVVKTQDVDDSNTQSDYFMVHFSIPMEKPELEGAFYLNGDFVVNQIDALRKLTYNFEHQAYEKTLLLKQGSYNYQYLFKKTGSGISSTKQMEGSYWETENEYQIYVYYKAPGERFDRLIGFQQIQSHF